MNIKKRVLFFGMLAIFGTLFSPTAASASPTLLLPPPMTISSMSCATGSHCFAVGSSNGRAAIAVTYNAGTTWTRQITPSSSSTSGSTLSGISCWGDSVCTAVGAIWSPTNYSPYALGTLNGGFTWTRQTIIGPPSPQPQLLGLSSVSCPSTTLCKAVGITQMGGGVILTKSSSSGPWTIESGIGYSLQSVSCASTSTCYASGSESSGSDFSALIVTTHNGGRNWADVLHVPEIAAGSGTQSSFSSIACVQTQCEAIGVMQGIDGGPLAFSSTDSGHTWKSLHLPAGFTPNSVRCTTVNSCFIAGGNTVILTKNNGATWTRQSIPAGVTNLTGIKCASSLACMSYSATKLIVTLDGGITWRQRTYP